jgi:hypothetical protein
LTFFDVYVERARDDSAGGRGLLAQRIAARFGLEHERVVELVAAGHFRVKTRVTDEIAKRLGVELQKLGAIVSIVDADSQPAPADEGAMSFRLGALDATALVALDGSAGEKREQPADAFAPPAAAEELEADELVELAEPEVLAPRPMPTAPATTSAAPAAPAVASTRQPVVTQSPSGQIAVLGGKLRDRPVVHAALGLVLALMLGFIPACLYAGHVRQHEIRPLVREEVLLTHRPPAVPTRTVAEVRGDITSIKWREFFVCFGVWVAVGGAGAWSYFRLT